MTDPTTDHAAIKEGQRMKMTDLRRGLVETVEVIRFPIPDHPDTAWVKIQGGARDSRIRSVGIGFLSQVSE